MDWCATSAAELSRQLSNRAISAVELAKYFLNRISLLDPKVQSFISVSEELTLKQAAEVDALRISGAALGPLAGVPVAVKDLLCTTDLPTTCGSKFGRGYMSPYDATAVTRMRQSHLPWLGKTNLDEFAMGGSTETSFYGITRNPWDLQRTPGGSSGGSAACLAAGLAPLSLGTDTGGSIRQPAAFCGVSGFKPTYGRISRYGLVAFASSLDQIGPMAHTVEDLALAMDVLAGHDHRDSTSLPHEKPAFAASLLEPRKSFRVGVVREQIEDAGLDSEIRQAVEKTLEVLKECGAEICEVSLPHSKVWVPTYYVIAPCEASSNLSRFDGAHFGFRAEATVAPKGRSAEAGDSSPLVDMYCRTRSEGFGAEVKRRIMLGTYALSAGYYDAYYLKALKVRRLIRQDFDQAFEQVDLLVGPTTPTTAFRIGEKLNDPVQMYLGDLYTVGANLAGLPALSIPCGRSSSGLPIGVQFQGRPLDDCFVLQVGHKYQQAINWKPMPASVT
jgi:aspartyl-tRNA(Asn)/glutamyl-tRNA(Gln) amidotransferase subunit A